MIRVITIFCLCLLGSFSVFAQRSNGFGDQSMKGVSWKERIYTGGGMGLGFNNAQDFISVSPIIGYRLTTRFTPGVGLLYRYTNYKLATPNIKLNDYGASVFARYYLVPELFLHTEYEHLNYEFPSGVTSTRRISFDSFLGGAGYVVPLGQRSSFYVIGLYNFSYRQQASPSDPNAYPSPWIFRVGANIGFLNF
ncbi:MAG TPA: hypothetical protein P5280_08790 [Cyclobacteriaceae bacterium]|nr:hypothetical protein [Cyclobacteriaceae bacterium]